MPIKPSAWSCLEIRMQGEVTVSRFAIVSLEGWELKYMGITLMNKKSIQEEMKSRS
jgi:hypothetical protein